jgi:hypothetical protein
MKWPVLAPNVVPPWTSRKCGEHGHPEMRPAPRSSSARQRNVSVWESALNQGKTKMSKLNHMMGMLAVSTALTGGALALGTITSTAASASVVMGGVPAPAPAPAPVAAPRAVVSRPVCHKTVCFRERPSHNRNHNFNRNRQRQHERQFEFQRQHLMRDFTLVVTPFQKSDTEAMPWQRQDDDTKNRMEDDDKTYYPNVGAAPAAS